MRNDSRLIIAAVAMMCACAVEAKAQFTLIDQTRSVTLNASMNNPDPPYSTVTTNTPSQTSTSAGPFNVSYNGNVTETDSSEPFLDSTDTNTGSQNSQISTSSFSDTANVSEAYGPPPPFGMGDINADSYFKTDFSVTIPTPFVLTAQYSMQGGGEGAQGTFNSYITLSEGSSTLFSLGQMNQIGGGDLPVSYAGGPTTYATTLMPGNTYEIVADAYIDRPIDGTTEGGEQVGASLTAGVPEPAAFGLLGAVSFAALMRRRGRATRER